MDDLCATEPELPSIKVVVVGDDNVGKSCLVTPVTVGSYCLTKIIEHSGITSKLQVSIVITVMM